MSRLSTLVLALAALTALPLAAQGDPSHWRNQIPEQPAAVVVRNATLWTSSAAGRLDNSDLLVRDGRIAAIGRGLAAPAGAVEIDGTGKHVTAGLIDAHSHAAIIGGVNEGTDIVTSEVRIGDVIDARSIDIYWQLAGGLTTANLLHGSANAIGGQSAVIKLRWGGTPEELLMREAPQAIKFALGENPKQSNWNVDERRYPQTRMGVEQVIREQFQAALDYRREWQDHARSRARDRVPPRRDLRLEALVEILEGKRDVHSHSYRADEILMLMRVAEDHGFRVKCFQHVLEGYKVADELAAHGAGASTFSDWWAYKYEVIDAIPYNGALMAERGVLVSFNSDDSELARRLNLEAAKAVRYGGMSETAALELVTINPARQLGVGELVGSLEPGKHADFVVWSGDPLSTYSLAEQTWIDGRRYFDRAADLEYRRVVAAERDALLKKVRATKQTPAEGEDEQAAEEPGEAPAEDEQAEEEPGEAPAEDEQAEEEPGEARPMDPEPGEPPAAARRAP